MVFAEAFAADRARMAAATIFSMAEVFVVDTSVDEVQLFELHGLQLAEHGADTGLVVSRLTDCERSLPYLLPTAVEVGVGNNAA